MDPQTQNQTQGQNPVPTEQPAPAVDVVSQVISTLQNGKNVLVTVGADPTVDELASALGLTFLLGKLDKHATAVFSGKIPAAMEFLDPQKTFENSVDSLRDFIIALDKEKADKLRYKVEDDVVKIFITPYRTVLSEKDLNFSQGDFNVDVVVALGVEKREELDKAIIAHGRILHDASVITVNAGTKRSSLGSVDWNDPNASSTAEMMVALSDVLGGNLLDAQVSTAFLTGIVAETNRFSNEKTSPRVMSLSAQLMAAGANQQLIATNLRQEGMISEQVRKKEAAPQPHDDDGEMVLDHGDGQDSSVAEKSSTPDDEKKEKADTVVDDNADSQDSLSKDPSKDEVDQSAEQLKETLEKASEPQDEASVAEETQPGPQPTPEAPSDDTAQADSQQHSKKVIEPLSDSAVSPAPALPSLPSITPLEAAPPMDSKPQFGGTLNATTAGAEEEKVAQQQRETEANSVALSHDVPQESADAVEAARQAVEDAEVSQPFNPANKPLESINAEPLPDVTPDTAVDSSVSEMQSSAAPTALPPEPSPVDAFMQPHTDAPSGMQPQMNAPTQATPVLPPLPNTPVGDGSLPPLPPLPGAQDNGGALPPLPPLPGQPGPDPAASFQPQINPGFMQDMPQSQNTWTQAGDDLAAQQATNDATREQKMDQLTQQYDQAVDRNREMQGLPPLNNPNGSGLPPLPPV